MERTMKVYTPGEVNCLKCGVTVEPSSVYRNEEAYSTPLSGPFSLPEAIVRKCPNCGHDWLEAPVDQEK